MIRRIRLFVGWTLYGSRNGRPIDSMLCIAVWIRHKSLSKVLRTQHQGVVAHGPFVGMKLSQDIFWGRLKVKPNDILSKST